MVSHPYKYVGCAWKSYLLLHASRFLYNVNLKGKSSACKRACHTQSVSFSLPRIDGDIRVAHIDNSKLYK